MFIPLFFVCFLYMLHKKYYIMCNIFSFLIFDLMI